MRSESERETGEQRQELKREKTIEMAYKCVCVELLDGVDDFAFHHHHITVTETEIPKRIPRLFLRFIHRDKVEARCPLPWWCTRTHGALHQYIFITPGAIGMNKQQF